jgi:MoaA/NifB/PqqE/SkfB family radical SAM enzyme
MNFWVNMIKREFDTKPIACHLYVTDQCNLDCFYCTEYDNSVPHPSLEDLKKWIRKIKELGCIRIGLQGGEPLLHPDIVRIVHYCKALDLRPSMATNGFRLTPMLIQDLENAGLDSLQVSVDRMTPIPSTRKSLKTLLPKLDLLKQSTLRFSISGVLFQETLIEAREILEYGLSHGIPTHFRLVHADPNRKFGVDVGDKDALQSLIDFQIHEKKKGRKVHTSWHLLQYQKALLSGRSLDWTCIAGYKYFFISAQGKFWLCSSNHQPNIDIMDVTPALLHSYFHKKECQEGCGVYCIISESLANNHPLKFGISEAWDHLQAKSTRLLG